MRLLFLILDVTGLVVLCTTSVVVSLASCLLRENMLFLLRIFRFISSLKVTSIALRPFPVEMTVTKRPTSTWIRWKIGSCSLAVSKEHAEHQS